MCFLVIFMHLSPLPSYLKAHSPWHTRHHPSDFGTATSYAHGSFCLCTVTPMSLRCSFYEMTLSEATLIF